MRDRSHLQLVKTEAPKLDVYVLGVGEEQMLLDMLALQEQGFRVINLDSAALIDDWTLNEHLPWLLKATHVMVPDAWWISEISQQLILIAHWLGLKLVDEYGDLAQVSVALGDAGAS